MSFDGTVDVWVSPMEQLLLLKKTQFIKSSGRPLIQIPGLGNPVPLYHVLWLPGTQ